MGKPTKRAILFSAVAVVTAAGVVACLVVYRNMQRLGQANIEASFAQINAHGFLGMPVDKLKQQMPSTAGSWTMTADAVDWEPPESAEATHRVHMVLQGGKVFAIRQIWMTGWLPPQKTGWNALDGKDHPEFAEQVDPTQPGVVGFQDGFETTPYLNATQTVRKKWQSMHPDVHLIVTARTSGPPEIMKRSGNAQMDQEALALVATDFPKPLDHNVPVWGFTVELP